jgi:MarR family transcriptional regulator, 2-MHQ and catechol-resistance regulon repressor
MPSEGTIKGILEYVRSIKEVDAKVLQEGLEIASLHREVERVIENDLAGWGLTARQVEIMEALYHNRDEPLTPAELSDDVGLTRSAMTSALDPLEKLGYTVREPHPKDRRMVAIVLTASGHGSIEKQLPERYRKLSRVMNILSASERAVLLRTYKKVLEALVPETVQKGK